MSKSNQGRIVELQAQLKIARDALNRIKSGARDPEAIADQALYDMMPADKRYPLQGLVGHAPRARP